MHVSTNQPTNQPINQSIYPSINLSIYLSICLYLYLYPTNNTSSGKRGTSSSKFVSLISAAAVISTGAFSFSRARSPCPAGVTAEKCPFCFSYFLLLSRHWTSETRNEAKNYVLFSFSYFSIVLKILWNSFEGNISVSLLGMQLLSGFSQVLLRITAIIAVHIPPLIKQIILSMGIPGS